LRLGKQRLDYCQPGLEVSATLAPNWGHEIITY
jgi:hypothetical protein